MSPPVYSGSMGADTRTAVLESGIAIFQPRHHKLYVEAGKKGTFLRLRELPTSRCTAPDRSCCGSVWASWCPRAPAPVNLSTMTSRARSQRSSILSCQRRTFWRRKIPTPGLRTFWGPWRRAFWGNSTCQMFLKSTARSTLLSLWWNFTTSTPQTARQSLSLMSYEASVCKVHEHAHLRKVHYWFLDIWETCLFVVVLKRKMVKFSN